MAQILIEVQNPRYEKNNSKGPILWAFDMKYFKTIVEMTL
jgi:hypothetical protein